MTETDRLRELIAINRIVTSSLDYDEVLQRVVEKTAAFTGAEVCVLLLTDPEGQAGVAASAGLNNDQGQGFRAPLNEKIGTVLGDFFGFRGGYVFTGVPVMDAQGLQGILAVYRRAHQAAEPDEEFLLSALADQAAIALQHARQHRRLRRDLKERETLTERIFDHAPLGLLVLSLDLTVRELNATAARLLGRPFTKSMGRPLAEVFGEMGAAMLPLCERLLAGEAGVAAEIGGDRSGATPLAWLKVRGVGLPNEAGRIEAVLLMLIDITERKRAEEFLRQTRDTLQAVLDAAPAGVVMANRHGHILLTSAATERILGSPVNGDAHGPNHGYRLCRLDGTPIPRGQLPLSLALAGQPITDTEILVARADGTEAIILASATPLWTAEGEIWGAVAVFQDISARKQGEQTLQQAYAILNGIIENTPDLIAAEDVKFRYLTFNQAYHEAFRHIFGSNIAIGTSMVEALAHLPEDQKKAVALWRRALEGERFTVEQSFGDPNRDYKHYELSFSPILNSEGHITGAAHIIRDITSRKQAEEALREADRRKDEFLAMLAHELRNPLAPIRNAVQILRRAGSSDPILQRSRDIIDRQVEHLARLVDDLLDISRITRGKIELRKESVVVADIVQRAVEQSRPLIEARRHELSVHLPSEPVYVEGDFVRLAQVVSNLLNNAAKYTDEGGRISVSAARVGSEVLIRVRDTGRGLDPAAVSHLFELFYQVDRTLDRAEGGLGIGLSLVKRLVEMHRGRVEAFSQGRGHGSEFVVRLPWLQLREPGANIPNRAGHGS